MPKISALTDGTALTLTGAELWPGVKSAATYRFTVSQALAVAGLGPAITTVDNTIPRFDGVAGKLQTSSVVIDDSNNVSGVLSLTMVAAAASLAAALSITQPSPSGASSTFALNLIKVGYTAAESIDGGSGPQNSVLLIQHRFGGSALKGGRQSLAVQAALTAASASGNALREYTSASFLTVAEDSDGGTAVTDQSTHKGTVYGANPYARVLSTSKWLLGGHGLEVNIDVQNTLASEAPWSVSGISIVPVTAHIRQGVQFDGGLVITGGAGTIGMRNGILFCNASGVQGVAATGSLMAIDNRDADGLGGTTTATFGWGIDFNSGSFTTGAFRSPGFSVNGSGAITGLTYNKVTITAPATGSTLTIADGKTLTVSNMLTFTGTDTSSVAFGTGGTVAYVANKLSVFAATTSAELAGVISDETGSGKLVFDTAPTFTTTATVSDGTSAQFVSTSSSASAYFRALSAGAIDIGSSSDTQVRLFVHDVQVAAFAGTPVQFRLGTSVTALFAAGTTAIAPAQFQSGTNLTTAAAGALEYDGKVIYGTTVASSRQVVNAEQVAIIQTDNTLSDVNTAQNIFASANDVLSLAASTTYEFEFFYWIARTAGTTSHTTAVLFPASSAFTSIHYDVQVTNPTGNVLGNVQQMVGDVSTAVTITAANTVATENLIIWGRGVIRTNSASTVTPQFQFSAAPGGAPTVKVDSFFRIWPIGVNTIAAVGNWA